MAGPGGRCALCDEAFEGWGNNAFPLGPEHALCCDMCNDEVVLARVAVSRATGGAYQTT